MWKSLKAKASSKNKGEWQKNHTYLIYREKTRQKHKPTTESLTGCRGWHRFFKLPIYRCGITLKTCSTPRVYTFYKNACQPRQPVMISFPELPENALAF